VVSRTVLFGAIFGGKKKTPTPQKKPWQRWGRQHQKLDYVLGKSDHQDIEFAKKKRFESPPLFEKKLIYWQLGAWFQIYRELEG